MMYEDGVLTPIATNSKVPFIIDERLRHKITDQESSALMDVALQFSML